jgi:hypothetical protein
MKWILVTTYLLSGIWQIDIHKEAIGVTYFESEHECQNMASVKRKDWVKKINTTDLKFLKDLDEEYYSYSVKCVKIQLGP